jgi:hypothetical protein
MNTLWMRIISVCLLLALAGPVAAQGHGTPPERAPRQPGIEPGSVLDLMVAAMETAHNHKAWQANRAVELSMTLDHGEGDPLKITAMFAIDSPAFRIATDGITVVEHDGTARRVAQDLPASLADHAAHVLMLEHALTGPFRLRNDDLLYAPGGMREVLGRRHYSASVTFADRDDWFILFADPANDQLHVLAYFISIKDDDDPRFSQAYAMVARETTSTDEVLLANTWEIWPWSRPRGLVGDEPIATLSIDTVVFTPRSESDIDAEQDSDQGCGADADEA